MPLSVKTRYALEKRSADWPFDDSAKDFQGDWNPEIAEWLMLAQVYRRRFEEDFPVPTIAELADTLDADRIDSNDPRASAARKIQNEIMRRLEHGESFSDLLLRGWVYQFWHNYRRRPTVAEIAELMGLSPPAFYRRYTRAQLYRALRVACGRVEAQSPAPDGVSPVQRANRKAMKPTAKNLQRAQDLRAGNMMRQEFASLMRKGTR
jgi:hypothetical protein